MENEAAEKDVEAVAATAIFPVDALQQLINHAHTFSGCNWCASIVLSTILIRTLLLPLTIHQTRTTYLFTLIRPQVDEIQEEIAKSRNEKNPIAVAVGEARMRKLLNEYRFNRFSNFASYAVLLSVNICFFFAIINMIAAKVESLNDGGAFYIFPFLTAFTFWSAMMCHGDAYISGNFSGVAAALIVPLAAFVPKVWSVMPLDCLQPVWTRIWNGDEEWEGEEDVGYSECCRSATI